MRPLIESLELNGDIELYLKEAVDNDKVEFEWIYGEVGNKVLTKEIFIKLKKSLDSNTDYTSHGESNTLDVRCEFRNRGKSVMSNIRASVHGLTSIKKYCLQDNFDEIKTEFIQKQVYKDPKFPKRSFSSIPSGRYPFRTTLKKELPLNESTEEVKIFLRNWDSKNKFFRYKKRYSYTTLNKLFRIDLTAIKSSPTGRYMNQYSYSKSFRDSGVLQSNELFELEIEYIGSTSQTFEAPPIDKLASQLNESINPFGNLPLDNTPFGNEPFGNLEEESTGEPTNIFTGDLTFADDDIPEYPLSPRYGEGDEEVAFDEPLEAYNSPRRIPDKVSISKAFWKDSDQEDIYEHIELSRKKFKNQDWRYNDYKFIPKHRRNMYKGDWKGAPEGEYVLVEISPKIDIAKDDKSRLVMLSTYVPIEYINDNMFELPEVWSWPTRKPAPTKGSTEELTSKELLSDKPEDSEEYSPDSPKLKGGGLPNEKPKQIQKLNEGNTSITVMNYLLDTLENLIHTCISIIEDTELYIDALKKSMILYEYIEVTDPTNSIHKTGWKFMGPQPVSMSVHELNPLNQHSIIGGYVVTEKADGVRALLFIDHDSRGYLITSKKEVTDTGITFEGINGEWLFDGEYITSNKDGEPIKLFMIFDVYYSSTEYTNQPHTYPWYSKKGLSRSEIIHTFKNKVSYKLDKSSPESCCRVDFKVYLDGPKKLTKKKGSDKYSNMMGIFKSAKKLYSTKGYEYSIDGLIFMPMYLPVKCEEEGQKILSIAGKWAQNYKWKPPEENTIDFKIKFTKVKNKLSIHPYTHDNEDGSKELKKYQKVELLVGYDEKQDESVDFNWAVVNNESYNNRKLQYFQPKNEIPNIHMTNIPLSGKQLVCEKDKRSIKDGDIVEMRYNENSENGFKWTPLRIRDDKVKPQFFTVANNIWQTIINPVTDKMITGYLNLDELEQEIINHEYYVNKDVFNNMVPIRDFHNYIKTKLISRICSSKDLSNLNIADLSIGRGGDIKKYLSSKNNVDLLLGLDLSSNINEAAQRFYYDKTGKTKGLFLQFDTSLSVENGEGCLSRSGNTEECSTLLNIVFGKGKNVHKKFKTINSTYQGLAKSKFDVVSSQFSLHYYLKDEETFRGFLENVKFLCKDGGYFIGACYDGAKVFDTFNITDKDIIEMTDNLGTLVYQIKKNYAIDDFKYDKDNTDNMYGNEIDVYMSSIGQHVPEYLVNFDFLQDMMEEYGFELALPTFRKGGYNPINKPLMSFDSIIESMDQIREKDSVFVRRNYLELYKIVNEEYKVLSGLNNLFVFKKK